MGKENAKRIGPRMRAAATIAGYGPISVYNLALRVGPHRSLKFGYAIVRRAFRANLLRPATDAERAACGARKSIAVVVATGGAQ